MIRITCAQCGIETDKPAGQVNRSRAAGLNIYCSRECCGAGRRADKKASSWHEARFIEKANKLKIECTECSRPMWFPPSKVHLYKRCSRECTQAYYLRVKQGSITRLGQKHEAIPLEDRRRECETCGGVFYPRPWQIRNGMGRFCSQRCNTAKTESNKDPEIQSRRTAKMAELRAAGLIKYRRGPDNPTWKGGKQASLKRRLDSGKAAASIRRYRKQNPDKVREFSQRRADRKTGRLPRGTVKRIGDAQRWKCAICRIGIKSGYHADHIMPLSLGGRHEAANIQLLCKSCNLHKSSRDPIVHMQSLGRLL